RNRGQRIQRRSYRTGTGGTCADSGPHVTESAIGGRLSASSSDGPRPAADTVCRGECLLISDSLYLDCQRSQSEIRVMSLLWKSKPAPAAPAPPKVPAVAPPVPTSSPIDEDSAADDDTEKEPVDEAEGIFQR